MKSRLPYFKIVIRPDDSTDLEYTSMNSRETMLLDSFLVSFSAERMTYLWETLDENRKKLFLEVVRKSRKQLRKSGVVKTWGS